MSRQRVWRIHLPGDTKNLYSSVHVERFKSYSYVILSLYRYNLRHEAEAVQAFYSEYLAYLDDNKNAPMGRVASTFGELAKGWYSLPKTPSNRVHLIVLRERYRNLGDKAG
jgi:hypothetical protein